MDAAHARRVGRHGPRATALAAVSAEAAKTRFGSYVVNCYAPDEGNMHTLLHWGTDDQKDRYLKPMCEGTDAVVFRHDRARGGRL